MIVKPDNIYLDGDVIVAKEYEISDFYLNQHLEMLTGPTSDYLINADANISKQVLREDMENHLNSKSVVPFAFYKEDMLIATSFLYIQSDHTMNAGLLIKDGVYRGTKLFGLIKLGVYLKGLNLVENVERIKGQVNISNIAGMAAYYAFGFRFIGKDSDYVYFETSTKAMLQYALLKLSPVLRGFGINLEDDELDINRELAALEGFSSLSYSELLSDLLNRFPHLAIDELLEIKSLKDLVHVLGFNLYSLA